MTDLAGSSDRSSTLGALREDLADEFTRVAAREGEPRRRRPSGSRRIAALGAALLLLPGSFAFAKSLEGTEHSFVWDGETIKMDGEILECPVDDALREELDFDPCRIMAPAPAPESEQASEPRIQKPESERATRAPAPLSNFDRRKAPE